MNTAQLKLFAQEAREILLQGVQNSLLFWGFDQNGFILEKPEEIPGGFIFRGEVYDDPGILRKWHHLNRNIQKHSLKDALEEASYTWFNRLMALSILEHNQLENPVIIAIPGQSDPPILANAKMSKMGFLMPAEQEKVRDYILDHHDEKAFGVLLVGFCRTHPLLNRVFGGIDDFTELLLPGNLLSPGGILNHINASQAISEDDYKEVELIGWLYQFYISKKKDEVFAGFKQNKKARPEDIPAATQIFTPRWIVKYMVENTLGRIWLDHYPGSIVKDEMKYLVHHHNQKGPDLIHSVTKIKLFDPAVGSGHILVVGFDLLMHMYKEEGYTTKPAAREILKNNLVGLDIDSRATQLACFATLLKASQYDPDILKENILPQIFAMPEADLFSNQEIHEFLGSHGELHFKEFSEALVLLQQGQNIGSALKFTISEATRAYLLLRLNELKREQNNLDIQLLSVFNRIHTFIEVMLIMTDLYDVVVTNPPYMGQRNMNEDLKAYVNNTYKNSKSDLLTVFIEVVLSKLKKSGKSALITLHSWMFTSTYEAFRYNLLTKFEIDTLLHIGRGLFGSDSGTVCFCLCNQNYSGNSKLYKKLFINEVDVDQVETKLNRLNDPLFGVFYFNQDNFLKIPGNSIAYWLSPIMLSMFDLPKAGEFIDVRQGLATTENDRFLRYWYEVSINSIGFGLSRKCAIESGLKWFPYNKGGDFRKWYGNQNYIVDWAEDGKEIKASVVRKYPYLKGNTSFVIKEQNPYFQELVSWTDLSWTISARYYPQGFLFDVSGHSTFYMNRKQLLQGIAYLNTSFTNSIAKVINSTFHFQIGDFKKIPFPQLFMERIDVNMVESCIKISQEDWDSNEISWDFKKSPLLNESYTINLAYQKWKKHVTHDFFTLLRDEVNINQTFIEIYSLKNELNSEVKLSDITILQDLLDKNKLEALEGKANNIAEESFELPLLKDEVIKRFLSYLLGCLFGRYRLDKPGLNITHPEPSQDELSAYQYNNHFVEIDQDAIIPILGNETPFSDDLNNRIRFMIEIIWGENVFTENLNFIEDSLGMPLEKFLVIKFWDYHIKVYKKTPIYWLFESPKGSFKVLTYMHRMDKYSVQKIRLNYLHRYIEHLSGEINRLKSNGDNPQRLEKLENALIDCREYSDILKPFSDQQITFDLDDGVKKNYKLFEGAVKPI